MLLVYLLAWLGIIDKKHTVVRKGVWNFALYSLLALLVFIVLALTGVLDRL
jgi:hypothetical protein